MAQRTSNRVVSLVLGLLIGVGLLVAWLVTGWHSRIETPIQSTAPAPAIERDPATEVLAVGTDRAPSQVGDASSPAVASAAESPAPADPVPPPPFPYGRPTPDWVFEQKYAGLSESEYALKQEEVAAAYRLVSKRAFQRCWDSGDYEIVPQGMPTAIPGDERIISGRSMPGSTDTQVARLDIEANPEVYQLFYEHLWISTTPWKP